MGKLMDVKFSGLSGQNPETEGEAVASVELRHSLEAGKQSTINSQFQPSPKLARALVERFGDQSVDGRLDEILYSYAGPLYAGFYVPDDDEREGKRTDDFAWRTQTHDIERDDEILNRIKQEAIESARDVFQAMLDKGPNETTD